MSERWGGAAMRFRSTQNSRKVGVTHLKMNKQSQDRSLPRGANEVKETVVGVGAGSQICQCPPRLVPVTHGSSALRALGRLSHGFTSADGCRTRKGRTAG